MDNVELWQQWLQNYQDKDILAIDCADVNIEAKLRNGLIGKRMFHVKHSPHIDMNRQAQPYTLLDKFRLKSYDWRKQLHAPQHGSGTIHLPYQTTALLFDLDDTLFDRGKTFYRWASAFVQAHFPLDKEASFQEAIDLLVTLDAHGYTPRKQLFSEFRQAYPWLQISIEALVETFYEQFSQHIERDAHLTQLLQILQDAHIPFGIVTNGSLNQRRKIEVLGLDRLTSCIFISELFGAAKPDTSIFLAAASCLQAQAERVLFIGDHPVRDIWGAHQTGMRTIWLHRSIEWPANLPSTGADMTIHSLEELVAFLSHPI